MDAVELSWILSSGLATGVGGFALLVIRNPSDRFLDVLLGFTAGVMLAATSFSLLVPALDRGSLTQVLIGLSLGGGMLALLDLLIPHVHVRFSERGHEAPVDTAAATRSKLLLSALTIHNIPEGMAVGVAFAAGGKDLGIPLALAIGVQNIPEGFAAAAPLIRAGASRRLAILVAIATGLVEPPAAFAAFLAVGIASAALPMGLAFAAGAMLYVVVDELIPESHAGRHERVATLGLLVGFALMLALDNAFG